MKVLKFCGSIFESRELLENSLWVVRHQDELAMIVVDVPLGNKDVLRSLKKAVLEQDAHWRQELEDFCKKICALKNDYLPAQKIDCVLPYLQRIKEIYAGLELTACDFSGSLQKLLALTSFIYTKLFALILEKEGIATKAFLGEDYLLRQMGDKLVSKDSLELEEGKILLYPSGAVLDERGKLSFAGGEADYLTCYLAKLLGALEIEFWAEDAGVPVCDPRLVPGTKHIESLSYHEAMELSHFGSDLINYQAINLAKKQNASIQIRSLTDLDFAGSKIEKESGDEQSLITGISHIDDIALFRVYGSGMVGRIGTAKRLFGSLAKANISLVMISQASSEQSICFAIRSDRKNVLAATQAIRKEFYYEFEQGILENIKYDTELASVSIVGHNMVKRVGLSGKMFGALGKNGVNVRAMAQGSSELNVSVVIAKEDVPKAVSSLYSEFFDRKNINLFLVGTGLIGATLLEQVDEQKAFLKEEYGLTMTLKGVADVEKMTFAEDLNFANWRKRLQTGQKSDLMGFVERIKEINCANSIFIDCTATEMMTPIYKELLSGSVSVVTPNKKANSDEISVYKQIHKTAHDHNAKFYYETNVGAGLPIISTLKDLLRSGDEIVEMQAVLSGTLSYIFNTFSSESRFVDVVAKAKELGYTEPNPKDDLTGQDVARKALILSREMGREMNLQDVESVSILPKECLAQDSAADFMQSLEAKNDYFAQMMKSAEASGKKLRFLATISGEGAKIGLEEVDGSSPFYSLSGSDNMVVFTTKRYTKQMPLVVSGPGAGAAVTAAGVFADIIKIANYLIY